MSIIELLEILWRNGRIPNFLDRLTIKRKGYPLENIFGYIGKIFEFIPPFLQRAGIKMKNQNFGRRDLPLGSSLEIMRTVRG
jgi:hypothetical protein